MPVVPGVGRDRHEGTTSQGKKIVLSHQAQDTLVIDHKPFTAERFGDPAIAEMSIRERNTLDRIPDKRLFLARLRGPPMMVVSGAADAGEPALGLYCQCALRHGAHHRLDDFVEGFAPGASIP